MEGYRQRKYNEDMMNVDKLGGRHTILVKQSLGAHALMEKLHSSQEKGLTPTDFEVREQFYSSNYKAPPKMTPYWRLFLNALDDFMLKFLSVCAVVQLVIEVSFADASHRSTCKCSKIMIVKWAAQNSKLSSPRLHCEMSDDGLNASLCYFCFFSQLLLKLLLV